MKQIKVPKEIQDVFTEELVCRALAEGYRSKWLPSLKEMYYKHREQKVRTLAWSALATLHKEVYDGIWDYNRITGLATLREDPLEVKEKKPRKPRKIKAVSTEIEKENK